MFQSDTNCMYLIPERAFVLLLLMSKVYSFLHRMASCRKRKLETRKNSQTLPCIPRVTFEDGLERVDNITRSILESKSFEDVMNSAAKEMKKCFDEDDIPDTVYAFGSHDVDVQQLFGLYDPSFVVDGHPGEFFVQLSRAMINQMIENPANNVLILLASITAAHEVSHVLLGQTFHLTATQQKFKDYHIVSDCGAFVERKLFGNSVYGQHGIQLFSQGGDWFEANQGKAVLGDEDLTCMLKKQYVDEIVRNESWRPPTKLDVERVDLRDKKKVGKKSPSIHFKCGVPRLANTCT